MKPTSISRELEILIKIQRPGFMWGPPGIGKSNVMAQVTDKLKLELQDVRAVLLDPVDLRGLPAINGDKKAHWCTPDFLPTKGKGVLFLDELPAAPPLVQAACYQLVLDRKLGEYTLPKGWTVMAAGNRETDRAVTHRMPSPLKSRFVHLDFEVDLEDWVAWALKAGIMTEVIAFMRWRPELLHQFDPRKNDNAFPTPRTWEFVSDIMKAKPDEDIEYDLVQGTVGEGAAAEFVGFLRIFRNLPDPDAVLMDPQNADVPGDPATMYALCGALARKASDQNIERLVKYSHRIPKEFSVMMVRDGKNHNPDIQQTRAFIEWGSQNKDVLM